MEFDQYAKEYGFEASDLTGEGKTDASAKDGKDAKKPVKFEHKSKISPEIPASIALLKTQAAQASQMVNNDKINFRAILGGDEIDPGVGCRRSIQMAEEIGRTL